MGALLLLDDGFFIFIYYRYFLISIQESSSLFDIELLSSSNSGNNCKFSIKDVSFTFSGIFTFLQYYDTNGNKFKVFKNSVSIE